MYGVVYYLYCAFYARFNYGVYLCCVYIGYVASVKVYRVFTGLCCDSISSSRMNVCFGSITGLHGLLQGYGVNNFCLLFEHRNNVCLYNSLYAHDDFFQFVSCDSIMKYSCWILILIQQCEHCKL